MGPYKQIISAQAAQQGGFPANEENFDTNSSVFKRNLTYRSPNASQQRKKRSNATSKEVCSTEEHRNSCAFKNERGAKVRRLMKKIMPMSAALAITIQFMLRNESLLLKFSCCAH